MNDKNITQSLENIIKNNPKSLVFARLAGLYLEQGRIDDAINLLEQGIQASPSYVTGHFVLAKAYIAKNLREKAEEALKKVISHDRLFLHAHKLLGDLMARIGWENQAAIHYRDILEIDPLDEETAQMLDTFSFSVKPPEGKNVYSGPKEKEWISGTPPIFERSEKVSQKKQELNIKAGEASSSKNSELDLSEFDLEKFAASGEGLNKISEDHSADNKSNESYSGELDLSDFDLDDISASSGNDNKNQELENTINNAEKLFEKQPENKSETEEEKEAGKNSAALPEDEPELAEKNISEPDINENLPDTGLDEIVNDINQAINQKSETENLYTEDEHLKDILLPDEDTDVKPEDTSDEPFFEEGFLSNITGTTDQGSQDTAEQVPVSSSEEESIDFFKDEEFDEPGISDQLFKDEDAEVSSGRDTVSAEDKEPEIEIPDSTEEIPADDTVSEEQEESITDVSDAEITEQIAEKKVQEESPEPLSEINEDTGQGITEQPAEQQNDISEPKPEPEPEEDADNGEKSSLKIVSPTLGEIYSAQGQFKKAIQVYEILIEKYPEDTEKYTQKINELKKKLEESS
ncbi:tetratricopeptide repeat protein [bacterium]|nr:tetratricopeptide repeat protein [bacterium]